MTPNEYRAYLQCVIYFAQYTDDGTDWLSINDVDPMAVIVLREMVREYRAAQAQTGSVQQPQRPERVPIMPVPETSGGKFDAKSEVEALRQIVRQLTDYVNELRRDVDRLQGLGE